MKIILYVALFLAFIQPLKAEEDTIQVHLRPITVIAKELHRSGTASEIGSDAIRHIQPTSLADIMQLLPGHITVNPDLIEPNRLNIRSLSSWDTSFDTGLYVDGLSVDMNSSLQVRDNSILSKKNGSVFGADVRYLSPDRIESVEVIRGIPSVRYGDLSSGAVVVKTKTGKFPYSGHITITPKMKLFSVGKGWQLPADAGSLSLNANYGNAFLDPRDRSTYFDRFGMQTGYSNDFGRFSLHAKVSGDYYMNKSLLNGMKVADNYQKTNTTYLSAQAFGQLRIEKGIWRQLEYRLGGTFRHEQFNSQSYVTSLSSDYTFSEETGEQEALYLPLPCNSTVHIDGKPYDWQGGLTLHIQHAAFRWQAGVEWKSQGNIGRGRRIENPDLESQSVRPLSYTDLSVLNQGAIFVQNSGTAGLLSWEAGVRLGLVNAGYYHKGMVDPRLNVSYRVNDRFTLRMGWGWLHKVPGLVYIDPVPDYEDIRSFYYKNQNDGSFLSVLHTKRLEWERKNLHLTINRKLEAGFQYIPSPGMSWDFTGYYERKRYGYNFLQDYATDTYPVYESVTDPNAHPTFTNGVVMNGDTPVPFHTETRFLAFLSPGNDGSSDKWGIEYILNFGRWEALQTSLVVDGAWMYEKTYLTSFDHFNPRSQVDGHPFPYIGIYEGVGNQYTAQRMNSNFRLITELPRFNLVTSLTLQAVWMNRRKMSFRDEYRSLFREDGEGFYRRIPIAYLDVSGNRYDYTPEMEDDPVLGLLATDKVAASRMGYYNFSPYFMLNAKVTKRFRWIDLSIIVNNITASGAYRVLYGSRIAQNPPTYVGLELGITF